MYVFMFTYIYMHIYVHTYIYKSYTCRILLSLSLSSAQYVRSTEGENKRNKDRTIFISITSLKLLLISKKRSFRILLLSYMTYEIQKY